MRAYERLLNYVTYDTTSDENAPEDVCPSTKKQLALADHLAEEMKRLGFEGVRRDEFGYVYGFLAVELRRKAAGRRADLAHGHKLRRKRRKHQAAHREELRRRRHRAERREKHRPAPRRILTA